MKEKELLSAVKNFGEEEGDSISLSVSADIDMDDLKHIVYLLQMMSDKKEEAGSENMKEVLESMFTHSSDDSEDLNPIDTALSLIMTAKFTLEIIADKFECDKEDLFNLLTIPGNEVEKELEKIYSRGTFFQA